MRAFSASRTVIAAVILTAACASPGGPLASPTDGPTATPVTASPSAAVASPAASPSPQGSPLPTLAPLPAPGEVAELVLRFQACDLDCGVNPGTIVLADGRVLRRGEAA